MSGSAAAHVRRTAALMAAGLALSCGGGPGGRAVPSSPSPPPLAPTADAGSSAPISPRAAASDTALSSAPSVTPAPVSPTLPAPTPPPANGSIAGAIVVIDPGHNGGNAAHAGAIAAQVDIGNGVKECDTVGAQAADGYSEHALNFDVAQRVRSRLVAARAQVVLTREDDTGWGPCITARAVIGNIAHAAAAISVHADGGPSTGRGFHVILPALVAGHNEAIIAPSRRLGQAVHAAFAAATSEPTADYIGSGGYSVRSDLGGLNLSTVPKVFLEMGNMNNTTDTARLEDPAYRDQLAAGIVTGLTAFLVGS
jgi:N-acetylmuramoyl-L-alanine amidase